MSTWKIKTPECYMTFSKGTYALMLKGFEVCGGKKSQAAVTSVALKMKVTMSSISWNEDIGEWVAAHTLGTTDYVHKPCQTSRYSIEVTE